PTLGFLVAGVPLTIAFAWVGVFLNSLFLSTQQSKGQTWSFQASKMANFLDQNFTNIFKG
ncbi:DUF771 domain-containing protein, partial [Bacillus safensis]|uniref:DUF771 domain-containing protein n=1 Tax=Bacillus safensis TaxID=561879 RepID=UPI003399F2A8